MTIAQGASDPPAGEKHFVTVLFSDICDSSGIAQRLELEEYAGLISYFRRVAESVIQRHGGHIVRLEGDGLFATFGHKPTREDDARRATEAALELHDTVARGIDRVVSTGTDFRLHSGVHCGLVFLLDEVGRRKNFDVLSGVSNIANRLGKLAGPGQIFVSAQSLGPQAYFFEFTALPEKKELPGYIEPFDVLHIHGRSAVRRRIDAAAGRGVIAFVGRSTALAQLVGTATQARAGRASILVVIGEPGIGKTRMVDELRQRLDPRSFRVLRGFCEGYLGAEPLQPFMQLIRDALAWRIGAALEENERSMAEALGALGVDQMAEVLAIARVLLAGSEEIPAMRNAALRIAAIVDLITVVASRHTVVIVLDDWQWADDASRQALDMLRARKLPLFILIATRPFNVDDHTLLGAEFLRLGPLEPGESDATVAAWMPHHDPFVVQEIVALSGGNPLFIEELCHAASAGDTLRATPRGVGGVAWINTLVASRLDRLTAEQAELLRFAAVAGTTFPIWLLERLTPTYDVLQLLASLANEDFLVPGDQPGTLRFKHVLTRDAVYATVESTRRRALHAQVAESLRAAVGNEDAFEWLEALSYHFDAAGMSGQAAAFAEAAGDKALAAMSLDRARVQYITALRALDASPAPAHAMKLRWCEIAQKLGQTCVFDPLDVAQGFVLFERAVELASSLGDDNVLARAQYWLAYVNYGRGRPRLAIRYAEAALAHAESSGDQRLAVQVRATLAQALASSGLYNRALPLFTQAVEGKRQLSHAGNRAAVGAAYTLGRMAYTFGDLGRFDEAWEAFDEALQLLGDNVHSVGASIRELMCAVFLWQGRWEEAHAIGLQGADIAMRCRSRYLVAMGEALSSCARWALDGSVESLLAIQEPTRWIEMRGGAVSTSLNYGWLVEAAITLGRLTDARHHAARLFARVRAADRHGEAQGCRALACLAATHGDERRALAYLARAERVAEFRDSPRERAVNRLAQAEALRRLHRETEARALMAKVCDDLASMKMAWHLAQAQALARGL